MPAETVRKWLRLTRLQSGAATAITAVFGAILLMPKDGIDQLHLAMLFFIGLLYHFYGFVLNEYSDVEVDRFAHELSTKPLIRGEIKRNHALYAALIVICIAFILSIIWFKSLYGTVAFAIAILLGAVYDLFGKKFFGADFVLGGSIFFFCLFGALTVSTNITPAVLSVAFLFFIQLSFQTGITGGMKDIPHDYLAGAKTSPVFLGCRVFGKRLVVTGGMKFYAIGIKVVHSFAIIIPLWLGYFRLHESDIIQLFVLLLLMSLMWITTILALYMKVFDRLKLMRILGAQEIVTYPITPILIFGMVGVSYGLFLLFFPIFWLALFLIVIYGKLMPDV
jgi:4-hydroxybenzoate polyprenyltransferase